MPTKSWARAGATLAAALVSAAATAATSPHVGDPFDLAHPAVRAFTDRDGLPQNSVHSIAKDALGYLWVATQDGAARWNGREWLTIDMPDRDVSNYIRTLVATPRLHALVRPRGWRPRAHEARPAEPGATAGVVHVLRPGPGAGGSARHEAVRDDRWHDLGRHGRRRRAAGRRALRDAQGRARGSAPVGDLRDRGRRGTQAHGRGRRGRAVDARGQPLVRDRPRPAGLRGKREHAAADEGPRGRAHALGRHLWQRRAAHPERARRALRPRRGPDEPPRHVARAHPARAGRRAALGRHARLRPLPPRRRALSGRAARPVHLRGLLAGGRRRRGSGRSLGRHAHGGPAPPRSRLVAGARPLVRAAGRPGAGAARDEGRGRPADHTGWEPQTASP